MQIRRKAGFAWGQIGRAERPWDLYRSGSILENEMKFVAYLTETQGLESAYLTRNALADGFR